MYSDPTVSMHFITVSFKYIIYAWNTHYSYIILCEKHAQKMFRIHCYNVGTYILLWL